MREILTVIANHYGFTPQLGQLEEECEELALACHKLKRHLQGSEKPDTSNLIEEIADVEIMTAQIKILLNCENLVDKVKDKKIQRQIRRMGAGE